MGSERTSVPDKASERVLVVDDERSVRRLIAGMVETTGNRVEMASSAGEARERLAAHDFALVVCDLGVPGEAAGLARWIREEHPEVAVLLATGTNGSQMSDAALALDAHGYLSSPFTRNEVAINVVNALHRRRLEIENREFRDELQQRYGELVDQLPAIVYLWGAGADGRCYYVSPAIESILGYRVAEWLADPRLWASRLHPEDRGRVLAEELRSREQGVDLACEYRMLARDGRSVWIRDEAVMIRNNGSPHHLQGLMYDVSAEKEAQASLHRSREETIRRLSRAAEFRDDETGAHIERMSRYCELIAARLGLDPQTCEQLRIASPMHDVGKIGIPDAILRKRGGLDPEERAEMERHVEIGYGILAGSGAELLDLAATIAWTHHEHFDGCGYPRGLEGEAIPLSGRIAAVADVFDALTNERVYHPAYPFEQAVEIMRGQSGTHFDPRVLDAFLAAESEIRAILRLPSSAAA